LDGNNNDQVNNTNGQGHLEHEVDDFAPETMPPAQSKSLIERLERALAIFSKWSTIIAGVALMLMLVISIVDVLGNKIFNHPLRGTAEYISFLAVITIAFAMAYALIEKAHVQIDVFTDKLPVRLKASIELFIMLASLGLFVLLGWSSIKYGIELYKSNTLSMTQRIPIYPFAYGVAFACVPACFYLILEFLRWGKKALNK
jgi:TRAP-type C4-dicarboxylate transport system permease small subunit